VRKFLMSLALAASLVGMSVAAEPRTTLPALADAEAAQPIVCPGDILIKAGFEQKGERYGLMYFGPYEVVDGKPVATYPHVWIRFEGDEAVAVLLFVAKDKSTVISMDELKTRYPSICDLAPVKA
jgi:hypothetical protein